MRNWTARFLAETGELPPERIALLLAAGLVLGIFPVMGCPTAMCLAAAFVFRLNPAALLLVNHVTSPLQWALLIPLQRMGGWICGGTAPTASPVASRLGLAALHAVAGWACVCIPLGVVAYLVLLLTLRRCRPGRFRTLETPA